MAYIDELKSELKNIGEKINGYKRHIKTDPKAMFKFQAIIIVIAHIILLSGWVIGIKIMPSDNYTTTAVCHKKWESSDGKYHGIFEFNLNKKHYRQNLVISPSLYAVAKVGKSCGINGFYDNEVTRPTKFWEIIGMLIMMVTCFASILMGVFDLTLIGGVIEDTVGKIESWWEKD